MRKVYIERQNSLLKIAIKDNDILRECFVEEETLSPKAGEIYKGIVRNIVPAMHCAFIDIGCGKNAYMALEGKFKNQQIKKGDEVLVEITKEETGKKGAKVTRDISIPGAYLVVTNEHDKLQISKKIEKPDFLDVIRKEIQKPDGIGIVIRTKAQDADISAVKDEAELLISKYNEIKRKFTYSKNPGLIYSDNGILGRVLRNYICSSMEIVVDNEDDYNFYRQYMAEKNIVEVNLELYDEPLSIFDYYGVERDILSLRHNKINLPSGGNIFIEDTEAMHVIDVNTASNMKSSSTKESVLITNMEAAKESARQMRLRNFGGITVIDFIDMEDRESRKKVLEVLYEGFKDDKNNTKIFSFTELSLVQISRKKYGKSITDYLLRDCACCGGSGRELSLKYISTIIKGKIRKIVKEQNVKNIYIEINSLYMNEIRNDIIEFVKNIDALDCIIYLDFADNVENFKVEPVIFHSQMETLKELRVYPELD